MELNLNKLRFVILPGSNPEAKYLAEYKTAYNFWINVWEKEFIKMNLDVRPTFDDFLRQTEIDCIFYENECIALSFMNWANFEISDFSKDSYFKVWDQNDISKLLKHGNQTIVCSNFTVGFDWRKDVKDFSTKDLLLFMVASRFMSTPAYSMTGTTRRMKSVHNLCYKFGAVPIREDVKYLNESVDLLGFYKNSVNLKPNIFIYKLGIKLWEKASFCKKQVVEMPSLNDVKINIAS